MLWGIDGFAVMKWVRKTLLVYRRSSVTDSDVTRRESRQDAYRRVSIGSKYLDYLDEQAHLDFNFYIVGGRLE